MYSAVFLFRLLDPTRQLSMFLRQTDVACQSKLARFIFIRLIFAQRSR